MINNKPTHLFGSLLLFTALLIFTQLAFFFVHYRMGNIIDALTGTAIGANWQQVEVIMPLAGFLLVQVVTYLLSVVWVWFVAISLSRLLELSARGTYWLGMTIWCVTWLSIFSLNHYLYPHSFFAAAMDAVLSGEWIDHRLLPVVTITMGVLTLFAYIGFFKYQRRPIAGWLILAIMGGVVVSELNDKPRSLLVSASNTEPNIIIIGLDSLRPDAIQYFGSSHTKTPHLNQFLQQAAIFTEAYSPLARTFPSWLSLLTAKFPLHNGVRTNLQNPDIIAKQDNLAKTLQANGYYTIYGSDEVRFSDITQQYGFNRVIRPLGGAAGFLIEAAQDFPITNLLVNLPIGRYLFPYNYGNRGAHITYQPDSFLNLLANGLTNRPAQPVFLAIHLCLTHWPFNWADKQEVSSTSFERYEQSINRIDQQFGSLLALLQTAGLLENSIVVILSDHGVTLGMPDDRVTRIENYRGRLTKRRLPPVNPLAATKSYSTDIKTDFALHTSYGQGTDVLSLKQNHVLLAMRGYGVTIPSKQVSGLSSLIDVAPTVLDYLHIPMWKKADGMSLLSFSYLRHSATIPVRSFFIETGDKYAEIERSDIEVTEVVQAGAGAYALQAGKLVLREEVLTSLINRKQRALIWGDWLLARYPEEQVYELKNPENNSQIRTLQTSWRPTYYVLVNLKTKQWTTDFSSAFAKQSPLIQLQKKLRAFYGDEV